MFGFIKKVFVVAMTFLGWNILNANPLKCISINNQNCRVRPQIFDFNSDEPVVFPFTIETMSMIYKQKCAFVMLKES